MILANPQGESFKDSPGETEFKGFPARMQFTPVPNIVFSAILPRIQDLVEVKVLFHFLAVLYARKGALKFIPAEELEQDPGLVFDLDREPVEVKTATTRALQSLVEKNILLKVSLPRNGRASDFFGLNTEANRGIAEKARQGTTTIPAIKNADTLPLRAQPVDIFSLYEQNIGIITPLIAEELKDAQKNYPEDWIREAVKEAIDQNKRNWRYIARILEKWSTEGKQSGAHRGNPKKATDPDKYIRGKYGHMVQR